MTSLSLSWHWWAATASAACVARLGAVADWWRSWLVANTLACLCLCQCSRFQTYLVIVNLFAVYLNFVSHHAWCSEYRNILRVYYKSMKYDVSFSQGSVNTLFRWGQHVNFVHVQKYSSCLQQCTNYKNLTSFSRVMITNVLPRFLWIKLYLFFHLQKWEIMYRLYCLQHGLVYSWLCERNEP